MLQTRSFRIEVPWRLRHELWNVWVDLIALSVLLCWDGARLASLLELALATAIVGGFIHGTPLNPVPRLRALSARLRCLGCAVWRSRLCNML